MGGMIRCKKCLEIMHSMYKHDFQACSCNMGKPSVYVDGGFDYTRIGGKPEDIEIIKHIHQDKGEKNEVILVDTMWASLM